MVRSSFTRKLLKGHTIRAKNWSGARFQAHLSFECEICFNDFHFLVTFSPEKIYKSQIKKKRLNFDLKNSISPQKMVHLG